MTMEDRLAMSIVEAFDIAQKYGQLDGAHHKAWAIDQMVRALTGTCYEKYIATVKFGPEGPDTYSWDTGLAP